MDRSRLETGISFNLKRNWRVLTASGLASVGLACGVARPALAEWWKSQSAKAATTTARPVQPENGFAATIRRLISESRRASDQGDHAKAIQLAERAAKISEASSQLLGSSPECSPRETDRFLAETRLRAEQKSVVAAPPEPATPTGPVIIAASPVVAAPASTSIVPADHLSGVSPKRGPQAQASAKVAAPVSTTPSKAPESDFEIVESPLFGARTVGIRRDRGLAETAKSTAPKSRMSTVPPAPSDATPDVDDLLEQSRVAATDGDLNRAIALAERAAAEPVPTTLFGPAPKLDETEANRWLKTLVAQQNAAPIAQSEGAVFGPHGKVALKHRSTQVAATGGADQVNPAMPVAGPAGSVGEPAADGLSTVIKAQLPNPEIEATTSVISADAELWTEDLPPAPAIEVKRDQQRFSRSTISHGGEWVDADLLDSAHTEAPKESRAMSDEMAAPQSSPSAAVEVVPEFPLGTVSTPGISTVEPGDSIAAKPEATSASPGNESSSVEVSLPRPSHVRLRHRGNIQQVAAEFPETTGVAPSNASRSEADSIGQREFEDTVGKAKLESGDTFGNTKSAETAQPRAHEAPVQRFPIQRVLKLQQRLESESAKQLSRSASPQGPFDADPGVKPFDSTPSVREMPPRIGPIVPADWFMSPEKKQTPEKAPEQPQKPEQEPPVVQRAESTKPVEFAKKPVLKLRRRPPTLIEEMARTADATVVPKAPSPPRQPSVGNSSSSRWQSVDSSETTAVNATSSGGFVKVSSITDRDQPPAADKHSAAEPVLAPPVSQVAFESPEAHRAASLVKTTSPGLVIPEAASLPAIAPPPPEAPPEWYPSPEKQPVAEVVVRKNSFAMVDQLAESLKIPVATLISLMGVGGLALFGLGLVVLRATILRRYN